jgi:flagellar basal body P-ring formation protein FlgA
MIAKYVLSVLVMSAAMIGSGYAQDAQLMLVPDRSIFPGERLSEADFSFRLFSINESVRRTYVFEKAQLQHTEAVRTLAAGKPVLLRSLRAAEDVKKGRPVQARYVSGGIEIQGLLVPLAGGSAGDIVDTRNPSSGEIVRASVKEDGTLLVLTK